MKRIFRSTLILLLAMFSITSLFGANDGKPTAPDFRYPKTVAQQATEQLDAALRRKDGEQAVDALVRYALAQSSISNDNAPDILAQVESVLDAERRPDVRALLRLLEAKLYRSYADKTSWKRRGRQNPTDSVPTDLAEWDDAQFQSKVDELVGQMLAEAERLTADIDAYPTVITPGQDSHAYLPTLMDFLMHEGIALTDAAGRDALYDRWAAARRGAQDTATAIYIGTQRAKTEDDYLALYARYRTHEESGLPLGHVAASADRYALLKEYAERFPQSRHAAAIINLIHQIEQASVFVTMPKHGHTHSALTATVTATNVNDVTLCVYRIEDERLLTDTPNDKTEKTLRDLTRRPQDVVTRSVGGQQVTALRAVFRDTLHLDGRVPFQSGDRSVTLPVLPLGYYLVVPYFTNAEGNLVSGHIGLHSVVSISDLTMFSLVTVGDRLRLFVVDSHTGRPVEGAHVERHKPSWGRNFVPWSGTTGADGSVTVATAGKQTFDDSSEYTATLGSDHYAQTFNPYAVIISRERYMGASRQYDTFTDLAIYRPGETVRFAALCYDVTTTDRRLVPGVKLTATLVDAAGNDIASEKLTADSCGRLTHAFVLPTDRMNGRFSIRLCTPDGTVVRSHAVEVSEYKAPTFRIDLTETRRNYEPGKDVTLRGRAETYTGLPVAGCAVRLSLTRTEWSWWRRPAGGELVEDTTVTTGPDGRFELVLPAARFATEADGAADGPMPLRLSYAGGIGRRFYNYQLTARVTDAAGESQQAATSFTLGRHRGVTYTGGTDLRNEGRTLRLPVAFHSSDEAETSAMLAWTLRDAADTARVVARGECASDAPELDGTALPSGRYLLRVAVRDDAEADAVEQHIIIYKERDTACPAPSPLWIPEPSRRVERGQAHILIGSAAGSHIFYIAQSRDRKVAEGWLHYDAGLHVFTLPMPQGTDEVLNVKFLSVADGTAYAEEVSLAAPNQDELHMELTSFRDRLVPGTEELWTLRFTDAKQRPARAHLLLELYQQALHDIAPNTWTLRPEYRSFTLARFRTSGRGHTDIEASWMAKWLKTSSYQLPRLNTYGRQFFGRGIAIWDDVEDDVEIEAIELQSVEADVNLILADAGPTDVRSSAMATRFAVKAEPVAPFAAKRVVAGAAVTEEQAMDDVAEAGAGEVPESLRGVAVREDDVKVALWEPLLTSGADGTVELRFTAPESNATWRLQAVAFNDRLTAAGLVRTVVTQRPVMVQPSLPRFVRGGDRATLTGLVQNATDSALTADVLVELFDLRTDAVLVRRTEQVNISGRGSAPVAVSIAVPDTLPYLGFRIRAAALGCGDGEQRMVPVLAAQSPVVEGTPFYLHPADTALTQPLDEALSRPDARLTLEVCANPVWYAALALPTVADGEYVTASSLAHNIFALTVAQGLAARQPKLRDAIAHWTARQAEGDSTLTSPLQRNADLKIGTLLASPWLSEAEQQTARMGRLADLTDRTKGGRTLDDLLTRLAALQMPDGGFAWIRYDRCRASYSATTEVLQLFGELRRLGYLADVEGLAARIDAMAERAVAWYDTETVRRHEEALRHTKEKDLDYTRYADFVYTRQLHPALRLTGKAKDIEQKCVRALAAGWGRQRLIDRAYTALILHRHGEKRTARAIVESLRQHALTDRRGMHWDRLGDDLWSYHSPVTLTSRMLQTLAEVDPRTDELDAVRKWLLLEKQTTDWGNSSLAADAVRALLATGSDWTGDSELDVRLGDRQLPLGATDRYLGYARLDLTALIAGGAPADALTVAKRGTTPAWGAVYAQYVAPMTAVRAARTDDLEVDKEFYVYGPDGQLTRAQELRVGDKVQVRLVIRCARTLEYVTLIDERGACFEPADRTSGYRWQDATCYYRETKDSETRLYFDRLGKGTHVYTYDLSVMAAGTYSVGIATAQCQYAAQQVAHTAGREVTVAP